MVKQVAGNGKSPPVLSALQNILSSTQHRFPMFLDFGMKQTGCLGEKPAIFFFFFFFIVSYAIELQLQTQSSERSALQFKLMKAF